MGCALESGIPVY